ncbi:signal recognition particle-docking protein FtsY, partial [Vibrio vulnificus]
MTKCTIIPPRKTDHMRIPVAIVSLPAHQQRFNPVYKKPGYLPMTEKKKRGLLSWLGFG